MSRRGKRRRTVTVSHGGLVYAYSAPTDGARRINWGPDSWLSDVQCQLAWDIVAGILLAVFFWVAAWSTV